ncbi:MAG: hypothetical protein BWK74_00685 [Desulfobacteraceae bacterium A6]|nr:MAG: hypothetical protein BWK74_00685 [Desulfobacteraceae bacterium A6]
MFSLIKGFMGIPLFLFPFEKGITPFSGILGLFGAGLILSGFMDFMGWIGSRLEKLTNLPHLQTRP